MSLAREALGGWVPRPETGVLTQFWSKSHRLKSQAKPRDQFPSSNRQNEEPAFLTESQPCSLWKPSNSQNANYPYWADNLLSSACGSHQDTIRETPQILSTRYLGTLWLFKGTVSTLCVLEKRKMIGSGESRQPETQVPGISAGGGEA